MIERRGCRAATLRLFAVVAISAIVGCSTDNGAGDNQATTAVASAQRSEASDAAATPAGGNFDLTGVSFDVYRDPG